MANKFESKILELFKQGWLLSLDQGIQGARFPTEGISNNIGFSRMVMNHDIIILD